MKTWTRDGYEVVEAPIDHNAGEDVNGLEDGNGNTIFVEKKQLRSSNTSMPLGCLAILGQPSSMSARRLETHSRMDIGGISPGLMHLSRGVHCG
ncbi:hypothetical protein [Paenibacillus phoenicis]|uniref:hypothetical protein n=1 Tax=Paenibacillus phoenicis TaxID=554117 RepID=UPI003D2DC182